MAVFIANNADAEVNGLKLKPLSAEAGAIVNKLPALVQPQKDGAVAKKPSGDLEEEVQAGGGGQDTPVVPGGAPALSVRRDQAHGGRGRPSWRHDQQRGRRENSASSAKGGSKGGAAKQADCAAGAGKGAAKAGVASARGKESVYQPTASTGMKRPGGASAPDPNDDKRTQSGYGRNTHAD